MTPERKAEILAGQPEGTVIVHVTPKIDETCEHEWVGGEDRNMLDHNSMGEPSHCGKCGLSFTRYIFCCMP